MEKKDTLHARWLSGNLSPEELAKFEASKEFEEFKKIRDASENLLPPPAFDKEAAWGKLASQIKSPHGEETLPTEKTKVVPFFSRYKYIAGAAAAILIFVLAYTFLIPGNERIEFIADIGQTSTVTFPDGSSAQLNGPATLSFNKGKWSKDRRVKLSGEAFFSVKKGADFTVESGLGSVKVLGTSFNVFDRNGWMDVSCHTGKVAVSDNKGDEIALLTPGTGVGTDGANQKTPYDLVANGIPGWINGKIEMRNVPLGIAIKELETAFEKQFETPDLGERKFTGEFDRSDWEGSLKKLEMIYGFQAIEMQDGKVKLEFSE